MHHCKSKEAYLNGRKRPTDTQGYLRPGERQRAEPLAPRSSWFQFGVLGFGIWGSVRGWGVAFGGDSFRAPDKLD